MDLKSRLTEHYNELRYDYDEEEIDNVIEILEDYEGDLNGLNGTDKTLLIRMIDDENLRAEVDNIDTDSSEDIFDGLGF